MTAEIAVPHVPEPARNWSDSLPAKIAYAAELANSGLLPASYRRQPANVLYAIEYAAMLGLAPMAAIQGIHVIEGKPTASSALMSALVRTAGHRLRVTGDDQRAACEITRSDDPEFTFRSVWTTQRAQQAGLTNKDVWKKYPANMLKARAISECARDACEEALMGMHYTPEELGAYVGEDELPTKAPVPQSAVTIEEIRGGTDWTGEIARHKQARDRDALGELWKSAKRQRPDDPDLLRQIEEAGERIAAARAQESAAEPVESVETPSTAESAAEPTESTEPADDALAKRNERRMFALLREAGVEKDREARLRLLSAIVDRPLVSSSELSDAQRQVVVSRLEQYKREGVVADALTRAQEDAAEAEYEALEQYRREVEEASP